MRVTRCELCDSILGDCCVRASEIEKKLKRLSGSLSSSENTIDYLRVQSKLFRERYERAEAELERERSLIVKTLDMLELMRGECDVDCDVHSECEIMQKIVEILDRRVESER